MASGRRQVDWRGREAPRLASACALLLAALAMALALWGFAPARAEAAACGFQTGFGSYSAGNQPGACWRPYNDASPFNRKLPRGAPTMPGSAAMVSSLLAGGDITQLVVGDPQRDGGVPIYWSQPSDPVYTLDCTKPWEDCKLEGLQIRVPAAAMPTGGFAAPGPTDHDAHLTVIDQQSGWEYDMWNVTGKTGSTITFGWGGRTRIDGDGLGSAAVAANYGSIAGPIRPEELVAGKINHALSMVVPCTDNAVYPATGTGAECSKSGLPASASIPMGAHFQLNMTRRAIRRLQLPRWKQTIVVALSTYGAYVSDTTGVADQWGFEKTAGEGYTSFGQADPWVEWARSLGVSSEDFNSNGYEEYWFDMAADVPWQRLRIVGECAAYGNCPPVSRAAKLKKRAKRCRHGLARWNRSRARSAKVRSNGRARRARRTVVRWDRRCDRMARKARRA